MPFEWVVALRFLREGRFQTWLIIGGATVGVAVVIFITALVNGLQANTIRRTLGTQAHIVVAPARGGRDGAARARRRETRCCRGCRRARSACARSTSGRRCSRSWSGSPTSSRCRRR